MRGDINVSFIRHANYRCYLGYDNDIFREKEMILMKFKINSVTNSANSEDDVEKFIKEWSNELAPLGLARIEKIDKYGYSNFYCSIDIKTPEDLISLTNAVGQIIVESYDDDPWITIYDDYMN